MTLKRQIEEEEKEGSNETKTIRLTKSLDCNISMAARIREPQVDFTCEELLKKAFTMTFDPFSISGRFQCIEYTSQAETNACGRRNERSN